MWYEKIKSISFSRVFSVIRNDAPVERVVGDVYSAIPPSAVIADESLRPSQMDLGVLWANYVMGGECSYYDDYFPSGTSLITQFAVGRLHFEIGSDDPNDPNYFRHVNVIFYPKDVIDERYEKGDQVEVVLSETPVNGFYADAIKTIVIGIDSDTKQMGRTLVHEMIHAIVDQAPELRNHMYGDTKEEQAEEITTHAATDFLSQLAHVDQFQFNVETHHYSQSVKDNGVSATFDLYVPILKSIVAHDGQEILVDSGISEGELHTIARSSITKMRKAHD